VDKPRGESVLEAISFKPGETRKEVAIEKGKG